MGLRTRTLKAAAVACLCLLAVAGAARGEIDRKGTLQATFNGGISPQKLPRTELTPVAVLMGGKITTTDRSEPPQLERIVLEINRQGKIENKGLPTCSLAKLNSLTSAAAK